MVAMGYKFRAPRTASVREWSRIERAIREGHQWEVATVRKEKPKPKADPKFLAALGRQGKKRPKEKA